MRIKALLIAALVAMPQLLTPAQGLAQMSNSRNGCMNQWLFNGVWRARITKVEPITDGAKQTGWQVTQTWGNGTGRELSPADSSLLAEQLALASGAKIQAEGHRQEGLAFNTLAPSGQFTYTQTFIGNNATVDPNDKPKALEVSFDNKIVSQSNKPHFTSNQYNFDYNLTCVATGAAAQAQGGSTQLLAQNGCMNQWMSNGVWRMRVTKLSPYPAGTKPEDQVAWLVTQTWVNITHGKVYPGGLSDPGNRVAPTNVSDEFLATKNGNNASTANTVGGFHVGQRNVPFMPNDSYTFDQLIGWSPFDRTDTPVRLLVTFDTATQKKVQLSFPVPQYHMPANFRINLTCGAGAMSVAQPSESQDNATQPTAQTQQPASAPVPQSTVATTQAQSRNSSGLKVDPCAMLSQNDVASALGVGAATVGTPQHPSANECAWAVASHAGAPAQNVVLVAQAVHPGPAACHGFSCLSAVTSVLGSHGLPGVPGQFADAFNDAQLISGLGDKASWKDGKLTVLRADMAFQLLVHGTASPALSTSEALARDVLVRVTP